LKGKAQVVPKSDQKPVQSSAGLFCFLCDKDDFAQNKDLVLKILNAAQVDESVVFFDVSKTQNYQEVFTFGLKNRGDLLGFSSFGEIAKSPDLKKRLWSELKKRIS